MHKGPARIRNVALVGHRGSGKTSLHEALLFQAGATNRLGSVAEGTTVSDFDDDEKSRGMSIAASVASFEWQDRKVNLIDTPGEPSFVADALGALRVCESAVFVVNAVMGVEVTTQRLWQRASELDLARLIFVNMLDRERADFFRSLESLKDAFGPHVVATEIPIGSEHEVSGVVDLVDMKAYRYEGSGRDTCAEIPIPDDVAGVAQEYREKLMDEVAENSDALMERYLEGEEISHDEIVEALKEGVNHGGIFPVTCGVATQNLATNRLLDAIVDDLPSPVKHGGLEVGEVTLEPEEDAELFAYVFKTRADQFAGRINLFRVYQGVMKHDTQLLNTRTHTKERIGQLLTPQGKENEPADEFGPGDIGAVAKLKETKAGDWLAARDEPITMPADQAPGARHGLRDRAQGQGRRGEGLHRPAPPPGGGPDDRPASRPADRRADRRRAHADPRRGRRRPPEVALRRRGQPEAAARALPGDDPVRRQGPRPPQEADRRPRPVRRLPHRDRAAAGRARASSSSTRSRAASSPAASSRRWRRGSARRCSTASWPATRSRTCASRCSTAPTTRSTPPRWPSRSPPGRP